jgi:hypothetical protein
MILPFSTPRNLWMRCLKLCTETEEVIQVNELMTRLHIAGEQVRLFRGRL